MYTSGVAQRLLAQIEEERRQFSKLFQESPSCMTIQRLSDGKLLAVNSAFLTVFEYDDIEVIGRSALDIGLFRHPSDGETFNRAVHTTEELRNYPLSLMSRSGKPVDVLLSATPLVFDEEKCVLTILQDVTALHEKTLELAESEDRLRMVINASPLGAHMYQLLPDGKLILAGYNPAAEKILNIDHRPLIGKPIEAAFPGITATILPETYRRVCREGGFWQGHNISYNVGKTFGSYEVHVFQTGPDTVAVQFQDVTERQQFEQMILNVAKGASAAIGDEFFLLLSEYLSRSLSADYVVIGERTGEEAETITTVAVFADGEVQPNFTYPLAGSPSEQVLRERYSCSYADNVSDRFPRDLFLRTLDVRGYVGTPLISSRGDILGIMAVMKKTPLLNTDMSESLLQIFASRAAAELERRHAEDFLRLARFSIENASETIFWHDIAGRFQYVNDAGCRALGYSLEELQLMNIFDIDPRASEETWNVLVTSLRRKGSLHYESVLRTKFGREYPVEIRTNLRRYGGGKEYVFSFVHDISERKRSDEVLAAEKERLAVTLRSINDGVITTDIDGHIILMNRVAEYLSGWRVQDALTRTVNDVFHCLNSQTREPYQLVFEEMVLGERLRSIPNRLVLLTRDGRERIITAYASPIRDRESRFAGIVLVFRDITEQIRIEEDVIRSEKLESIGVLAGGIAHDFNNLLTGILGNISLAQMMAQGDERLKIKLEEAARATERARELATQLLTFSKGGTPVKKTLAVDQIIMDSASFSLRGSNVRCDFRIPEHILPVDVDPTQMNQVINNLILNADQAMPDGGTIHISADNVEINELSNLPLRPGMYVVVSITDEGEGIPSDILPKIFDPYFTTKKRGSGLGLSTVYSVIKRHNGHISLQSEQGKGTTFTLYLPASEHLPESREAPSEILYRGTGKILVMDDEEVIRSVAAEILTHLGYEVVVAEHGDAALIFFEEAIRKGQPFDAVIMDLTIPGGMGGKELIRHLLLLDPNVKAIVSSGYSNDPILAFYQEFGFRGVVIKPYKAEDLSKALHDMLQM